MAGKKTRTIDAEMTSFDVPGGIVIFADIDPIPVESDCEKLLRLITALQGTYAELCPILQAKRKPAKKKVTRKK